MKKSIWSLLILAPLLPEISTGSSSIESLSSPVHLVILLLGYGLAVLVIREFSIRRSLSYVGIYILGIAFGVFNEGFLAKVLIKESYLPITQYDGYGVWGGVNMGFTLAISFWHALFSVLIPILIVHKLTPETSTVPWLSKRASLFSGALLVVLGYLSLFGSHIVQGNITQALILSAIILLCFAVGVRFKKKEKEGEVLPAGNFSWRPVWLGMSLFVSYFILTYLAGTKANFGLFVLVLGLIVFFYARTLRRRGWSDSSSIILFGIGGYFQQILLGLILSFVLVGPAGVFNSVLVIILLGYFFLYRLAKNIIHRKAISLPKI